MAKNPPFSLISTSKIIQMNDVWTSYDSKSYALEGVNLSIDRGTNYAIVGQSGSGKSTLLKLMNGMMIPSKGIIKIDYLTPNMNNKKFKKMMHTIGYIPQSLGLVKNISVMDNILIGALPRLNLMQSVLKQFPENEIQEAKNILKLVGLSGKESRKAYMLSGGEKRRVAIARALMQKPTILLADEIVSELDHVTSREIMDLICQKNYYKDWFRHSEVFNPGLGGTELPLQRGVEHLVHHRHRLLIVPEDVVPTPERALAPEYRRQLFVISHVHPPHLPVQLHVAAS